MSLGSESCRRTTKKEDCIWDLIAVFTYEEIEATRLLYMEFKFRFSSFKFIEK